MHFQSHKDIRITKRKLKNYYIILYYFTILCQYLENNHN